METDSDAKRLMDGYTSYKNGNYSEAFRLFSAMWDDGLYQAGVYLGDMYRRGLGVAQDAGRARELLELAASHGVELAALRCAELSRLDGRYQDAFRWYSDLAAAGNLSAQYWLYILYRDGNGVQANSESSLRYLEQAAEGGHFYAMRDLSRRYLRGKYGLIGVLKGIGMVATGTVGMAFELANQPGSERLR